MSGPALRDPSRRFFFCHLQKTAGTSLIVRLSRHFGQAAIYPNATDGDPVHRVVAVRHLLGRWKERGDGIRMVTGHFPLCTTELLGGGFTTLTVLRDPVERVLSQLRHRRRSQRLGNHVPLEALYDNSFQFQCLVHNHMVKMLSLRPKEMTHGAMTPVRFTRDHLERARDRLSTIDVVGDHANFEDFCDELTTRFGIVLGEPVRVNWTAPEEVPATLRERIARDNALDVELYASARALVRERRGAGERL